MGNRRVAPLDELLNGIGKQNPIILLDTNMLVSLLVNPELLREVEEELASPLTLLVPESVLAELEKLRGSSLRIKRLVETIGPKVLGRINVVESVVKDSADRDLQELAQYIKQRGHLVIVATNDVVLRKKLRRKKIHVAFLRKAHDRMQTSLGKTV